MFVYINNFSLSFSTSIENHTEKADMQQQQQHSTLVCHCWAGLVYFPVEYFVETSFKFYSLKLFF
jgi:tRNA G37 N-methylase Trm5